MRRRADEEGNKQRPPGSVGPGGSEKRRTSVNLQVMKKERKRKDMKKFKRLSSIAMAAVMTAAMTSPAFAATITVNGAIDGETYKLYKIFDYVSNENKDAYSYTMPSDSPWRTLVDGYTFDHDSNEETAEIKAFTLTPAQNDSNILVVAVNEEFESTGSGRFCRIS